MAVRGLHQSDAGGWEQELPVLLFVTLPPRAGLHLSHVIKKEIEKLRLNYESYALR